MALIIKDRVKETTTTTGTGTVTLAGASTGFRSFADIGNANTTYYTIAGGTEWEVGLGTYTASGTTLSRDTVLSNSLGTTALINFSAGDKDVFCTYPSGKAILGNTSAVASTGTGSVVLSDSPTMSVTGEGFTLQDETDNTKQAKFDLSGITTATTRTYTLPNTTGALATLGTIAQTFSGNVTCSNALIAQATITLSGNGSSNNVFSTGTTTGTTTIGGTGQTGALTLGQSTGAQTVNIATGVNNLSAKTLNLGTGATNGATTVNIAPSATTNGNTTVNIATQARNSNSTTVNIGTNATGGNANVNIGSTIAGSVTTIRSNTTSLSGILNQQTYTVGALPTGVAGSRSFVTDALAPTFGAAVASGGAVGVPVYHDGTSWKVG